MSSYQDIKSCIHAKYKPLYTLAFTLSEFAHVSGSSMTNSYSDQHSASVDPLKKLHGTLIRSGENNIALPLELSFKVYFLQGVICSVPKHRNVNIVHAVIHSQ